MANALPSFPREVSGAKPHQNLHAAVLGTSITCVVLVSAFISARLTAKKSISNYHIEDYLLIITWPLLLGYAIAFIISAYQGAGEHIWNVSSYELQKLRKTNYVVDIFYALTTWCGKTALLCQLQRIFSPTKTGLVYTTCFILKAAVTATYSVVTLVLILQCVPVRKVWDPSTMEGRCLNEVAVSIATGIINVVTDFSILALPVWAIFQLKMPLKRKFTTSAIFGTGLLACACSLCRMVYAFAIEDGPDYTYNIAKLGISAVCEITAIILCTCFPLMIRFVQICKSTILGSRLFASTLRQPKTNSMGQNDGKTLTDDSCLFCDDTICCAIHMTSSDNAVSHLEREHESNNAVVSSHTAEQRNSEVTQFGDTRMYDERLADVVVH